MSVLKKCCNFKWVTFFVLLFWVETDGRLSEGRSLSQKPDFVRQSQGFAPCLLGWQRGPSVFVVLPASCKINSLNDPMLVESVASQVGAVFLEFFSKLADDSSLGFSALIQEAQPDFDKMMVELGQKPKIKGASRPDVAISGLNQEGPESKDNGVASRVGMQTLKKKVQAGLFQSSLGAGGVFQVLDVLGPLGVWSSKAPLVMGVLANRLGHLCPDDRFFHSLWAKLTTRSAQVWIVPFGSWSVTQKRHKNRQDASCVELCSSEKQAQSVLVEALQSSASGFFSLGGADLDPALYHEINQGSQDTNRVRDEQELRLIQALTQSPQGVFFGICRGHQALAVAHGASLIQDLKDIHQVHRIGKATSDNATLNAWHVIELVAPGLMWKDLWQQPVQNPLITATGEQALEVNSRHHQAVNLKTFPKLSSLNGFRMAPLAVESSHPEDLGTVLESFGIFDQDGKVCAMGVQFHPEDMEIKGSKQAHWSAQIFDWMVSYAQQYHQNKLKSRPSR
jgi:gamma-glutamyl-gamma-aminobutyrate hydrolase PuuD